MLRHHYQSFYLEHMSRRPQLPEGFEDVDFQHAARHADDNRECIRLLGLSFIQQGHSVTETSSLLKVTNDAVHDWLHRFKEGGLSAMRDQGGRGRKPVIPEDSHDEFKEAVLQLQDEKDGGRIVGRDVLKLPPCAPELNSSERLWEWMREHDLSNKAFSGYENIVDCCCEAWNNLCGEAGRLFSLCSRDWAVMQ